MSVRVASVVAFAAWARKIVRWGELIRSLFPTPPGRGTPLDRLAGQTTWLLGAAARSGHELDLFEAQMVTALRDERGDHGLLVSLCAREHRRLLAAVVVAPLPQADERDMNVAALSGQVVLVPRRPFLIANPLEESFVDQP